MGSVGGLDREPLNLRGEGIRDLSTETGGAADRSPPGNRSKGGARRSRKSPLPGRRRATPLKGGTCTDRTQTPGADRRDPVLPHGLQRKPPGLRRVNRGAVRRLGGEDLNGTRRTRRRRMRADQTQPIFMSCSAVIRWICVLRVPFLLAQQQKSPPRSHPTGARVYEGEGQQVAALQPCNNEMLRRSREVFRESVFPVCG
jgi:hypothetical protein